MKTKRQRIPMSVLSKFAKSVSGRSTRHGESLLDHAAECLMKLGIERPAVTSSQNFVHMNRDQIIGAKKAKPQIEAHSQANAFAMTDAFLSSYEWRRVRMAALKRHGAVCQCCGASPKTGAVMNVDHIKPRKLFPELSLDVENLQVLCQECNHGKGNWDMTDWRQEAVKE